MKLTAIRDRYSLSELILITKIRNPIDIYIYIYLDSLTEDQTMTDKVRERKKNKFIQVRNKSLNIYMFVYRSKREKRKGYRSHCTL